MIWTKGLVRYGLKNFKKHMDIKSNVTFKGLIRRFQRKYPKSYNGIRKGFIISSIYIFGMALIPGSSLPLQKQIKIDVLSMFSLVSRMWLYNSFFYAIGDYLIKLNELILMGFDNQIFDISMLSSYFREIEEVAQKEKKRLRGTNYLDLLLYSEIILQNILRYSNKLLLEQSLISYYEWIYETSLKQLSKVKITTKEEKHIKMFYSIAEYLLKFGNQSQVSICVLLYLQLTKQACAETRKGQNLFQEAVAKRAFKEQNFLNSLKQIYGKSQLKEVKQTILQIFQQLDQIYKAQQQSKNN